MNALPMGALPMNALPMNDQVEHARALLLDARAELSTDPRLGPGVAAELTAALRRLDEPLRVALAGTLKSGKSTLLNALVGEEIAPTDACECTRVVTWFERSRSPEVHVEHDGGRRTPLPIHRTDGRLALDLGGIGEDRVERLSVGWPSSLLERYTIIDTPGTSSNSAEVSARTEAFLTPEDGVCPADAVVYLMRSAHSSDLALLRRLHDHSRASGGPLGVLGALSRADELDGGEPGSLAAARWRAPGSPPTRAGSGRSGSRCPGCWRCAATPCASPSSTPSPCSRRCTRRTGKRLLLVRAVPRGRAPDAGRRARAVAGRVRPGRDPGGRRADPGRRHRCPRARRRAGPAQRAGRAAAGPEHPVRRPRRAAQGTLRAPFAAGGTRPAPRAERPARLLRMVDRALADTHVFTELRTLDVIGTLPLPPATRAALEQVLGGRGTAPAARLGLPPDAGPARLVAAALAAARHWRAQLADPLLDGPTLRAYRAAVRSCEAVLAGIPARIPMENRT